MTIPVEAHANDNRSGQRRASRFGRWMFVLSLRLCVASGFGLAALVSLIGMGVWVYVVLSWLADIIFATTRAMLP